MSGQGPGQLGLGCPTEQGFGPFKPQPVCDSVKTPTESLLGRLVRRKLN